MELIELRQANEWWSGAELPLWNCTEVGWNCAKERIVASQWSWDMSEDERDVRERLRQHVRERLRLLKEERGRQTRQANASHGEITEVAPDVVEELSTSQKK
jgi:hypothetical protein